MQPFFLYVFILKKDLKIFPINFGARHTTIFISVFPPKNVSG